jgi:hypothetical protein
MENIFKVREVLAFLADLATQDPPPKVLKTTPEGHPCLRPLDVAKQIWGKSAYTDKHGGPMGAGVLRALGWRKNAGANGYSWAASE